MKHVKKSCAQSRNKNAYQETKATAGSSADKAAINARAYKKHATNRVVISRYLPAGAARASANQRPQAQETKSRAPAAGG